MWGGGTSDADRAKGGSADGTPTIAQLAAAEMRTQKRLAEMQDALNLILQRMPETLGPSQGLPASTTPVSTTRSVAFKGAAAPPASAKGRKTGEGASSSRASSDQDEDPASRLRRHGTLTVHVVRAQNLIKADVMGLSDPYVQITVAGQPKKRTETIKKTLNPEWDDKIDFEGVLEHIVSEELVLEVPAPPAVGGSSVTAPDPTSHRRASLRPYACNGRRCCLPPRPQRSRRRHAPCGSTGV